MLVLHLFLFNFHYFPILFSDTIYSFSNSWKAILLLQFPISFPTYHCNRLFFLLRLSKVYYFSRFLFLMISKNLYFSSALSIRNAISEEVFPIFSLSKSNTISSISVFFFNISILLAIFPNNHSLWCLFLTFSLSTPSLIFSYYSLIFCIFS